MSKIGRIYNAALSATSDRRFITKVSKKKKLSSIEQNLKVYVENTSGPSTNNVVDAAKRWGKAYKTGIKRLQTIEALESQFREPSVLSQIIDFVARVIKK